MHFRRNVEMKYFYMQTIIYESKSDYNEVIIMFYPLLLFRKKILDAIDLIKTYKIWVMIPKTCYITSWQCLFQNLLHRFRISKDATRWRRYQKHIILTCLFCGKMETMYCFMRKCKGSNVVQIINSLSRVDTIYPHSS